VSVEVTGIPAEKFTILISELDDYNIGLGGKTLKEIKASR
jgi:phenylpyruvate tautomerase PptA (4-oxalocrotonate tautomerase family)